MTQADLPHDIVDGWIAPDGRARVSILPKGDPQDAGAMRAFADAVLAVEPTATEGPIATLKAGDLVLHAFIEAGALRVGVDRRAAVAVPAALSDVVLTLFPLALAGIVTMELMSLIGMSVQLRQHHRVAVAARRRRRVQDLLHRGLARRARPTCCRRR